MLKERQRKDAEKIAAGLRDPRSLLMVGQGDLRGPFLHSTRHPSSNGMVEAGRSTFKPYFDSQFSRLSSAHRRRDGNSHNHLSSLAGDREFS